MSQPTLSVAVPDALVEAIAQRVVQLLGETDTRSAPASPWLDVDQAAAYMRCKRQRVYDLVSAGQLKPEKDGRRSLFKREQLDAYLEEAA